MALSSPSPPGPEACTAMKVRRLARQVTQIYDTALAPHGLTIGQMSLLAALRRREGVRVAVLAQRLGVDASTLSRLLRPLEAAGFLALAADPGDGRVRLIHLTEAGHHRRAAATAAWRQAQDDVAERLGGDRLAALRFLLDDAYHHLSEGRDMSAIAANSEGRP